MLRHHWRNLILKTWNSSLMELQWRLERQQHNTSSVRQTVIYCCKPLLLCLNDSVSQMRRNWPSCRQSDSSILDYEAINHNDLVGEYTANFCTYECAQLMVNHIVVYLMGQLVLAQHLWLCCINKKPNFFHGVWLHFWRAWVPVCIWCSCVSSYHWCWRLKQKLLLLRWKIHCKAASCPL